MASDYSRLYDLSSHSVRYMQHDGGRQSQAARSALTDALALKHAKCTLLSPPSDSTGRGLGGPSWPVM
eukprot:48735-Eustigmatos_ZCMA.PRE.1